MSARERVLDRLTRRGFLKKASATALVTYGVLVGVGRRAVPAAGASSLVPLPCGEYCTVLWCDGCACGGDYFSCTGCGETDKKYCFTGHNCTSFCLVLFCNERAA